MIERRPVIRHIATSYDGPVIVVAEFERFVQIWDTTSQRRIAEFETTLDSGGCRLAVTRDGLHCAVGAYNKHGIAVYTTKDGAEVWRRKDLKKVQTIRVSLDGQRLMCGFSDKAFELLDIHTGESRKSDRFKSALRGATDVFESPCEEVLLIEAREQDFKLFDVDLNQIAALPRTTEALDFAFAPKKVCISECGDSIRCYDTHCGKELWAYHPGNGIHAIKLTYDEAAQLFVALMWPYETGGDYQLVTIDPENGQILRKTSISESHTFAFSSKGSLLISNDGKIINSKTSAGVGILNFFQSLEKTDSK